MKKYTIVVFLMLIGGLLGVVRPAFSAVPPAMAVPPVLAISEIKITGDEFLILKNNTGNDISDLSAYWLDGYNSNQPLGAGVTNSSQQLPAVKLANGQTILLSSNGMNTCGAAVTAKLSVGLTDGGGYLQIVQTAQTSLGITKLPIDVVSWSSGADDRISSVPSSTKDPKAVYYRYAGSKGYAWQLADTDSSVPCQLNVASAGSISSGLAQSDAAIPTVAGIGTSANAIDLPANDIGLVAPQISEVLPNPASPQTDTDDEFIELYNSNDQPFDLGGFILQVGTTTTHKYTFASGTSIGAHDFTAFYSADTSLSLSNSDGQVVLMDPSGNVLSQTDEYSTAKDGYAWVKVDGLWQWTTTPTAGAANVLTPPVSAKTKAAATTAKKTSSTKSKATSAPVTSSSFPSSGTPASSLHPAILAGVGSLAVVYALYEYRNDLANQFYKLRRYRAARRVAG